MEPKPGNEAAPTPEELLKAKEAECQEYLNTLKRVQADFINYQDRIKREKEEWSNYAVEGFAREVLAVVDHLEQAIGAFESGHDLSAVPFGTGQAGPKKLLDGVKITQKEFQRILGKFGIVPIQAGGEKFDPALHEAVMMKETTECDEMTVLRELRKGYTLGGRILRPAQVEVSRKPAPPGEGQ